MDIEPGTYEHFKGERVEVIGVGHHSETLEKMVLYRALSDSDEFGPQPLWVRPLTMFTETVERDGVEHPRFTKI